MRKLIIAAAAALSMLPAAQAAVVAYNFAWTGNGGYTMTGNLSFDSAAAADGAIRDGEVSSLFFEGFLNGVTMGSNSTAQSGAGFNFNFDPVAGQFFLGGDSGGDSGQIWNFQGTGLGFAAGSFASALSSGTSNILGFITNPAQLFATRAGTVSEPGSLALVALSIAALGSMTRRRASRRVSALLSA